LKRGTKWNANTQYAYDYKKISGFVPMASCTVSAGVRSIRGVRRYTVLVAALLVGLLGGLPRLHALTDEEKRQEFLDARGDSSSDALPTATPHHKRSPTPEPDETPHHRHSPTPEPDETPHHKRSPTPEPEETPHHRHSPTPEPDETPHHKVTPTPAEETPSPTPRHRATPEPTPRTRVRTEETPKPEATVTPAPRITPEPRVTPRPERTPGAFVPQPYQPGNQQSFASPTPFPRPTAAPTPPPGPTGSQIDIEKEGLEQQGGLEPPVQQPPARHHWWQVFSTEPDETQYHYLTKAIRDAIDRAPVARHRWRFIVVHNSGTRQGNARIFDYYHRYVRKMPNGLAYHFVIGNGTSSGNGQIEIGGRWIKQLQGGHVHSDYLNNISLGICLVGDFNRDLPTDAQKAALEELIRYLRKRVGTIDRKQAIVKAHREINPPQWPTDCPGDRFPYQWLHSTFD